MTLSIVAPAYNNPGEVDRLLCSLSGDFERGMFLEAVIVDDGSNNDSIKHVASAYRFARYIRLDRNSGASKARNEGARQAKGDIILFLDSDVVIMDDTVERVNRYFENKDSVALVGRMDEKPLNDGFFPRYKSLMFNTWLPKGSYSTVFDSVMGAIRKDVFFECGGFDEEIKGATVEYVKLGFELQKKYKIAYDSGLVARVNLKSFKKALGTDFYSTMKWVEIFSEYGRFDNNCTTPGQAAGRLFGFFSVASIPLVVLYNQWLVWFCLFLIYLYANKTFFLLALQKEGFFFLARSIPVHAILSVMTVLGGIAGIWRILYKRLLSKNRK